MGSFPRPRLTDDEICQQYREGKSQAWLGLKARLSSARIREILVARGVRIRQSSEALRLSVRARPIGRASSVRGKPTRPVYKGDLIS